MAQSVSWFRVNCSCGESAIIRWSPKSSTWVPMKAFPTWKFNEYTDLQASAELRVRLNDTNEIGPGWNCGITGHYQMPSATHGMSKQHDHWRVNAY